MQCTSFALSNLVINYVNKVERALALDEKLNKEYLPIDGLPEFRNASLKLLFGADSPAIAEKRVMPPFPLKLRSPTR